MQEPHQVSPHATGAACFTPATFATAAAAAHTSPHPRHSPLLSKRDAGRPVPLNIIDLCSVPAAAASSNGRVRLDVDSSLSWHQPAACCILHNGGSRSSTTMWYCDPAALLPELPDTIPLTTATPPMMTSNTSNRISLEAYTEGSGITPAAIAATAASSTSTLTLCRTGDNSASTANNNNNSIPAAAMRLVSQCSSPACYSGETGTYSTSSTAMGVSTGPTMTTATSSAAATAAAAMSTTTTTITMGIGATTTMLELLMDERRQQRPLASILLSSVNAHATLADTHDTGEERKGGERPGDSSKSEVGEDAASVNSSLNDVAVVAAQEAEDAITGGGAAGAAALGDSHLGVPPTSPRETSLFLFFVSKDGIALSDSDIINMSALRGYEEGEGAAAAAKGAMENHTVAVTSECFHGCEEREGAVRRAIPLTMDCMTAEATCALDKDSQEAILTKQGKNSPPFKGTTNARPCAVETLPHPLVLRGGPRTRLEPSPAYRNQSDWERRRRRCTAAMKAVELLLL